MLTPGKPLCRLSFKPFWVLPAVRCRSAAPRSLVCQVHIISLLWRSFMPFMLLIPFLLLLLQRQPESLNRCTLCVAADQRQSLACIVHTLGRLCDLVSSMFADGRGGGGGILPGAFSMEKIEPDAAQGMSPPASEAAHYVRLCPVHCNTCTAKIL